MVCDTKTKTIHKKRAQMSDLYQILQVPKDADTATIKKAYRRLAKLYHPDRHRDATEDEVERAEELFRQVKQAYEVLGTEERRRLYDRYGDIALNPNFKGFQAKDSSRAKKGPNIFSKNPFFGRFMA